MPDPFLPLNPLGTCSSGENRRFQVKMAPCVDPPVSWSVAPRSQNPVVAGRIRGSCTPLGIMTRSPTSMTPDAYGVALTGVHSSTKRFTPTRSGVWGCSRPPTSTEPPKWPPTRAPWCAGVLPPAGNALDYRDRGGNSRSGGCPETCPGNTGSNPVRGTSSQGRFSGAGPAAFPAGGPVVSPAGGGRVSSR